MCQYMFSNAHVTNTFEKSVDPWIEQKGLRLETSLSGDEASNHEIG